MVHRGVDERSADAADSAVNYLIFACAFRRSAQ
jgi:hypothetical protein